jgi:hypothetical protein
MNKLDTALLRIGLAFGAFFAFLIAIEAGFIPARFRGEGMFFRWQLWLLAGIFAVTVREQLAAVRCCTCRQWNAPSLSGLFGMGKIICQPCREVREFSGELARFLDRSSEGVLL